MTTHWGIIVGINHYRFFQPLSYAQKDAQILKNFLVDEADFAEDCCLLLTETSPQRAGRSTYPTQDHILGWIQELTQQHLQPGDVLWCFFSGYGVCFEGQDYLMPIDGNPANVPGTGIALRSLYESLKQISDVTVLVLLDVSRSQAAQATISMGNETLELARDLEVPTILSCQPGEFSHESSVLKQGFFTVALINGLRTLSEPTLAALDEYLAQTLPQLNDQHWHPLQHPMTVVASPLILHQPILPKKKWSLSTASAANVSATNFASVSEFPNRTLAEESLGRTTQAAVATLPRSQESRDWGSLELHPDLLDQLVGNPRFSEDGGTVPGSLMTDSPRAVMSGPPAPDYASSKTLIQPTRLPDSREATMMPQVKPTPDGVALPVVEVEAEDPLFWRRLLLWGGLAVVLLCLGVIQRNQVVFTSDRGLPSPMPAEVPNQTGEPTQSLPPSPTTTPANVPITVISSASPTISLTPVAPAGNPPPLETLASPSPTVSPSPAPPITNNSVAGDNSPQTTEQLLTTAFAELQSQNYQEALRLLGQVPDRERTRVYVLLQSQAEEQANQAFLSDAKVILTPNLASRFNDAIKQARRILPNQPLYQQSQRDIDRWSEVILDLAEGRAQTGNYSQAIAAAQLVPNDRKELYPKAQQMIERWQAEQDNLALLLQAGSLITEGSASSYNKAIEIARKVPAGQPKYPQSQRLIEQWSQDILKIATQRAEQSRFRRAIEAAELVPDITPAHAAAQEAIANWKQRL